MYDFGGGPFEATLLTRTPTGFSVTATVTEISATRRCIDRGRFVPCRVIWGVYAVRGAFKREASPMPDRIHDEPNAGVSMVKT